MNGNFDEQANFTQGSVELTIDTGVGLVGVSAKIDDDTNILGGTASWKKKVGVGSIGVSADLDANGNITPKMGVQMPF